MRERVVESRTDAETVSKDIEEIECRRCVWVGDLRERGKGTGEEEIGDDAWPVHC